MANAIQVAATRVALAITALTSVRIANIDDDCIVRTIPANALGGTFQDVGIEEPFMEFYRDILAKECPEIANEIRDRVNFPLHADMDIVVVVDTVSAMLLSSTTWQGNCAPLLS